MGFLKNLKAQIEAAQAAGNAMAGGDQITDIPPFVGAWPQEEVDRLLAGSGPIRAIVISYSHQNLDVGERVGAMRVRVTVRPRGAGLTVGDAVTVTATLSSTEASLLDRGLDVPAERDPVTGVITGLAVAQLKQELATRTEDARKRNPRWGLDRDVEGMIEVAQALGKAVRGDVDEKPAPPASASDPRRQPVDGLSWETYVTIRAHLQVHGAPNGEDQIAQQYGVRPGTWLALGTFWKNRIAADPDLVAMYEGDLAAAADSI